MVGVVEPEPEAAVVVVPKEGPEVAAVADWKASSSVSPSSSPPAPALSKN